MNLLFDENLSRKLVLRLADLYPDSIRVVQVDLLQSSDVRIWEYAGANGFVIVTADADFFELAATLGPPPKAVSLRRWERPTRDVEEILRAQAIRITEFAAHPELGLLVLDKLSA